MKLSALVIPSLLALTSASAGAQTILRGPVYNPGTGSRYYMVEAANWNAARAKAVAMGGDLVVIDDAAENEWVRSSLAAPDYKVFIGLSDAASEGTFVWSTGKTPTYFNWHSSNKNTAQSDYVYMEPTSGKWLTGGVTYEPYAIIEIKGPLRVPQEFPNFAAAMTVVGPGMNEIALAAGDILMGSISEFYRPGQNITVTGAGAELTRLLSPSIPGVVEFNGNFTFSDMTFHRRTLEGHLPYLTGGASRFSRCWFTAIPGASTDSMVSVNGDTQATFDACRFENLPYGGIFAPSDFCGLTITNSVFRNIGERAVYTEGMLRLINCTLTRVGNESSDGVLQGSGTCEVLNSIFWNNAADPAWFLLEMTATYSDIQGGFPGAGNISTDPMFTSESDVRLQAGSPCVDAGNGAGYFYGLADCGGMARAFDDLGVANSGRGMPIDMGCFERQSTSCPADFDGSGFVDTDDFTAFVQAFESGC